MILTIAAPTAIPSAELEDWGKVKEPIGQPVAELCGRSLEAPAGETAPDCGIWECSPGNWRRQIVKGEFCHFLAGRARFHADDGQIVEIRAGNSYYFPPKSFGTWQVIETVRKVYFIVA